MTSIVMNAKERTRFFKFAVVGVIGAVVDFGIMNLMVAIFRANLVIAGTISFIAAILSNFTWNRYWTYPDSRSKPIVRQLTQFSIVSIAGLVIRLPILALVEPIIHRMWDMLQLPNFNGRFFGKKFHFSYCGCHCHVLELFY
jgi:putative flippase GtrA